MTATRVADLDVHVTGTALVDGLDPVRARASAVDLRVTADSERWRVQADLGAVRKQALANVRREMDERRRRGKATGNRDRLRRAQARVRKGGRS